MSNKTRKRIWPASLVLAVAMIGVLAAFVVLAAAPQGTSADGGAPHSCAGMTAAEIAIHNALDDQLNGGNGQCLAAGATPTMTTPTTPVTTPAPATMYAAMVHACVTSSSTSASSGPELKLVIEFTGSARRSPWTWPSVAPSCSTWRTTSLSPIPSPPVRVYIRGDRAVMKTNNSPPVTDLGSTLHHRSP